MKIQIASDLHLEFPANEKWIKENPLISKGDILLLAGDIVVDKHEENAMHFYETVETNFPQIISTMGNHEFYHGDVSYAYPDYSKQISKNHIKLNNKSIIFDGVKFIVSTLWSFVSSENLRAVSLALSDYRLITYSNSSGESIPLEVEQTNKYHEISLNYIKNELEKPFRGKIVIMTHHLPSYRCVNQKYKGDPINSAFASDLDEFIITNPQITLWACGHSHGFVDTNIGSTRIIANPLGYVEANEHGAFKRDFCIEI